MVTLAFRAVSAKEMFSLEAGIISTKTVLDITEDGYKVSWDDDDALSVTAGYGNSSSRTYEFTKGEGNTFYCRNVSDPSDITSLDVYYPYTEDAVITVGSAKGGVQTQNGTGSAAHIDGPLYGHAVISVGHSHPHYVQAIKEQAERLVFYSNSVVNSLQQKLADKLGRISGYDDYQLFLINSGAEANENALKLASFHTARRRILSFSKAFHGRTSLAVEATDKYTPCVPNSKKATCVP